MITLLFKIIHIHIHNQSKVKKKSEKKYEIPLRLFLGADNELF